MDKLLIATRNPGKMRELAVLLADAPAELVSLADVGIDVDVEETGATFEANAALKARSYCALSGLPTLADDSGLEVDALGGEPGIYSARYAGEGATDEQRIALLYERLHGVPASEWDARFRCVIALVRPHSPDSEIEFFVGECEGRIVKPPRGDNGFGYDPAFLFPSLGRTMAELSTAEKNRLSHRGMAASKVVDALKAGV